MKEINEAMQMRIFDLLEGNLSDLDKAKLLNEIAASTDLQREYNLMSKTYLSDNDPIEFIEKSLLYRKPGFAITFNPLLRYAAASVVLIACGIAGWYYSGSELKNSASDLVKKTNTRSEKIATENSKMIPSKNSIPKSKSTGINKAIVTHTPVDTELVIKKLDLNKESVIFSEIIENKIAAHEPLEPEVVNQRVDTAVANNLQNVPIPLSRKRSLSYKLINGGRTMLANLELPNIKFSTEKNKNKVIPTVKMTISTLHTDVIATLIE
jgi:hypothetical protein